MTGVLLAAPAQIPTVVEVWHGGIPNDAPRLPLCTRGDCHALGGHSHTVRISDHPFSVRWDGWIRHHMSSTPALVVHVVPGRLGRQDAPSIPPPDDFADACGCGIGTDPESEERGVTS